MGQDFYRRIVGYNDIEYATSSVSLSPGSTLELTISNAPGIIDGFINHLWNSSSADYHNCTISIIVDGMRKLTVPLRDFLGGPLTKSYNTLFSTNTVHDNGSVTSSYRVDIPYSSNAVFIIKNGSTGTVSMVFTVVYHCGI